ncbi:MAG: hypothetical protein JHC93_03585 [Parachlamydiales bacterium]|nr:hypothetical protein [Parachlamydiales bacterium]
MRNEVISGQSNSQLSILHYTDLKKQLTPIPIISELILEDYLELSKCSIETEKKLVEELQNLFKIDRNLAFEHFLKAETRSPFFKDKMTELFFCSNVERNWIYKKIIDLIFLKKTKDFVKAAYLLPDSSIALETVSDMLPADSKLYFSWMPQQIKHILCCLHIIIKLKLNCCTDAVELTDCIEDRDLKIQLSQLITNRLLKQHDKLQSLAQKRFT